MKPFQALQPTLSKRSIPQVQEPGEAALPLAFANVRAFDARGEAHGPSQRLPVRAAQGEEG